MVEAFIQNPILLLFIVAGLGYWIGSIKIRGSSLGVAAVLFVGLGFGALSPELHIPEIVIFLGLTIFVYTIGLSSGPGFFETFRQRGFRDIFFVIIMLTFSAAVTVGVHFLFHFDASTSSGLFAGSTTNTAALAGLLDVISKWRTEPELIKEASEHAVIGYSLSYPMGVLGVMIAIAFMRKVLRIDFAKEERELKNEYPVKQEIVNQTVLIKNPEVVGIPIRDLKKKYKMNVVFGRYVKKGETALTHWDTIFEIGNQVSFVGDKEEVERVTEFLGEAVPYKLSYDGSAYDVRRIFVSNPKVAGERIAALNLQEKFSTIITRVTRGDMDILANANTVIELGDRVRFVARRKDLEKIAAFFGDSYDALSKINLLSFGLGMGMGLLLGMVTIQLPGGVSFELGFAGGPIIVALILGALRKTGPIVWSLPYSANLVLRQIGLMLLLAGIGINSGHNFVQTLMSGGGGIIFLAGTIISCLTALATLFIGYKILKIPFSFLMGMVAGQPAILDFAMDKSGNKLPIIGFTLMLPVALITKVVYVQFLFALLK
jgi:putative transport protein